MDGFSEYFGQTPGVDCEIDYDRDADDDAYRAIDSDYDLVWDWKDTDLGAADPRTTYWGIQQSIPVTYRMTWTTTVF